MLLIIAMGFSVSAFAFQEPTEEKVTDINISNNTALISENRYKDSRKLFPVDLKSENEDFAFSHNFDLLGKSEKNISPIYNFSIDNDKLTGEFSGEIVSEQSENAVIVLAVYDNGVMTYADILEQTLHAGSNSFNFNDISASFKGENLSVKTFILKKSNFSPICSDYEFAVCYAPQIYIDEAAVSHDTPMYIYDDEIMASVNVLQKLGVLVQYDSETGIIYTMKNNHYLNMQLDNSTIASKYGEEWQSHTTQRTPTISHNDIYIPLSTVCDIYNFETERDSYTGVVKFYTNEFLTNESQNPEYCSFISNGLIFYSVVEQPYIYITDGSATISYAAGGPVSEIIVEGEWIYYYNNDNEYIYRMNMNDGSKTALFYSNPGITLFNGKIYTDQRVYNIATGKSVSYGFGSDAYYILDRTYVSCVIQGMVANAGDRPASVTVKIVKVNTDSGEIAEESSVRYINYSTYNSYHHFKDAVYMNDEWYISLRNPYDTYMYFTGTSNGKISDSTKNNFEDIKEMELIKGRGDSDKYSKTNSTSVYKFTVEASSGTRKIVRINRKTQFKETLISTSNYAYLAAVTDDFMVYYEFVRKNYVITALNIMLADTEGNIYGALGYYSNGVFTPTI